MERRTFLKALLGAPLVASTLFQQKVTLRPETKKATFDPNPNFLLPSRNKGSGMASALYNSYKQSLLDSSAPNISSGGSTVRAIFVTSSYVFSASHANFSDLTNTVGDGGTGRANGEQLLTITITNGAYDAADTVFASVTGTSINAIVLYVDSGVDATSSLIAYIDGISLSPSAAQVTIQWDTSIFTF